HSPNVRAVGLFTRAPPKSLRTARRASGGARPRLSVHARGSGVSPTPSAWTLFVLGSRGREPPGAREKSGAAALGRGRLFVSAPLLLLRGKTTLASSFAASAKRRLFAHDSGRRTVWEGRCDAA